MPYRIQKRARLGDVLTLRQLIDHTRDDLIQSRHELDAAIRTVEHSRLRIHTCEARFDSVVDLYNRLVTELEPPAAPARRRPKESPR